jgi:hypothetical protein
MKSTANDEKTVPALALVIAGLLYVHILLGYRWQYIIAQGVTGGALVLLALQFVNYQIRYKLRYARIPCSYVRITL